MPNTNSKGPHCLDLNVSPLTACSHTCAIHSPPLASVQLQPSCIACPAQVIVTVRAGAAFEARAKQRACTTALAGHVLMLQQARQEGEPLLQPIHDVAQPVVLGLKERGQQVQLFSQIPRPADASRCMALNLRPNHQHVAFSVQTRASGMGHLVRLEGSQSIVLILTQTQASSSRRTRRTG